MSNTLAKTLSALNLLYQSSEPATPSANSSALYIDNLGIIYAKQSNDELQEIFRGGTHLNSKGQYSGLISNMPANNDFALDLKASASPSVPVFRVKNNSNVSQAEIDHTGKISAKSVQLNGATSGNIILTVPATIAVPYSIILPNAKPTANGQVMLYNTDGTTSFGSGGGGSSALSSLTAATATNTLANVNFLQEWQWDGLTSGTGFKLSSSNTGASSNTQKLFEIVSSGANATSGQTTYSSYIRNIHTGTSSTNVALYLEAGSGSNNYALIVGGGNVSIGGLTPTHKFELIQGTITTAISSIYNTVTWNNAGTTFDNILTDITATAYNSASTLINLKVGGSSVFNVSPRGQVNATQGNITSSIPFINHSTTWNGAGVTFNNIISNITDTTSATDSTLLQLRVGGTGLHTVYKNGHLGIGTANGVITNELGIEILSSTSSQVIRFHKPSGYEYRIGAYTTDGNLYITNNNGPTGLGGSASGLILNSTGNVGVRVTPDSSVPLVFFNGLGGKINLYKGTGNFYGFGIQANTLQIICDSSADRVGIGYGTSASFTETLSIKGASVGIGENNPTTGKLVITQGTVTSSLPGISHTATWNNAAVTFKNIFSNITDTASNAASELLSLQVGGSNKFRVIKSGDVYLDSGNLYLQNHAIFLDSINPSFWTWGRSGNNTSFTMQPNSSSYWVFAESSGGNNRLNIRADAQAIGMGTSTPTSFLHINQTSDSNQTSSPVAFNCTSPGAAGELTASSGTQIFAQFLTTVNQTSTAGFTVLKIASNRNATGSGSNLLIDAHDNGSSVFSVSILGDITARNLTSSSTGIISFGGNRSQITSPSDGRLLLANSVPNNFTLLGFGVDNSSSFPGIKVSGDFLGFDIRTTDDSTYASLKALNLYANAFQPNLTSGGNLTGSTSLALQSQISYYTLTGNLTITSITSANTGTTYTIVFIQDATGTRTVTWPSTVKWSGGTAPMITVGAGKVSVVYLTKGIDGTTNFIGTYDLNYY